MTLDLLIRNPKHAYVFAATLLGAPSIRQAFDEDAPALSDRLLIAEIHVIAQLLWALAQTHGTVEELRRILHAGVSTVVEWLAAASTDEAAEAAQALDQSPEGVEAIRWWTRLIDEAVADPTTVEMAEARAALAGRQQTARGV